MSDKAKVFISWSGTYCSDIAQLVKKQIEMMFDGIDPFMSKDSIGLGAHNIATIFDELQSSKAGIFVVTRDTMSQPWINFEAGALSMKVEDSGDSREPRKVIPLLVDFDPEHLEGPLRNFQGLRLDEEGWPRLLYVLAGIVGVTEKVVDDRLKGMESSVANFFEGMKKAKKKAAKPTPNAPTSDEMFEKVLVRMEENRSEIRSIGAGMEQSKRCDRKGSIESVAGVLARAILDDPDVAVAFVCSDGCYSKTGPEDIILVDYDGDDEGEQAKKLEEALCEMGVDTVRIENFRRDDLFEWV